LASSQYRAGFQQSAGGDRAESYAAGDSARAARPVRWPEVAGGSQRRQSPASLSVAARGIKEAGGRGFCRAAGGCFGKSNLSVRDAGRVRGGGLAQSQYGERRGHRQRRGQETGQAVSSTLRIRGSAPPSP